LITVVALAFVQQSFAQDTIQQRQLSDLLTNYYNVKDALIAGNAKLASAHSTDFIKTANSIDYKLISEGNINALLKDATAISKSSDIESQRKSFSRLSDNMAALAKKVKLTSQLIYKQYCPMKKANWLSNEQVIKNPYYGNAMLTCGSVVETINE